MASYSLMGLNAYERHKKFVHDYLTYYGGSLPSSSDASGTRTDWDVLKKNHRFLRTEEDDATATWEVKLAKRYYDKLFKEYCLADLSRYKEGKIGMRWRTQKETVVGKGQFVCGNKKCDERKGLASYEVNFGYVEAGEQKQALVKLRVCPECAAKLNYKKQRALAKAARHRGDEEPQEREEEQGHSKRRKGSPSETSRQDRTREESPGAKQRGECGEEGGHRTAAQGEGTNAESAPSDENVWRGAQPKSGEPTAAEEMDKYFDDMFL